jgi:hypothetical protein
MIRWFAKTLEGDDPEKVSDIMPVWTLGLRVETVTAVAASKV